MAQRISHRGRGLARFHPPSWHFDCSVTARISFEEPSASFSCTNCETNHVTVMALEQSAASSANTRTP